MSYVNGTNLGKFFVQKSDNRIVTLDMKPLTKTQYFFNSNNFKNTVIIFGVCLSIFTISFFKDKKHITNILMTQTTEQLATQQIGKNVQNEVLQMKKVKTHHNFMSSYFLHESSIKRERSKTEGETGVIRTFVKFQKFIFTSSFSL